MAVSLSTSLSAGALTAYSIQMGYTPLKHLDVSGAYFREYGNRGPYVKGENRSYLFSLGVSE
ncbi:MAG: hypothetical protein ACI8YQ_000648 [Polaribacter sp.]|jgi:hypothetical protein